MNVHSNSVTEASFGEQGAPPMVLSATRPMYWSIRREVWENRSLYIAPLIVASIVLFASLINTMRLPQKMRTLPTDPAQQHARIVMPFSMAPAPIMLATFVVGFFYSLEALYGERRDRSILFWKSLPVSDWTTVLSKASIPLIVLPLFAFALSVTVFFILLLASTVVLIGNGMSPAPLWSHLRFIQEPVVMFYGLAVHALWWAPMQGWLLLVSAWAKRAPVLWAFVPLFGLSLVERMVFNSSHVINLLKYRFMGAMTEGFAVEAKPRSFQIIDRLGQLDPLKFFSSAGLWVGLIFAAVFLAAAVRLRRNREPI